MSGGFGETISSWGATLTEISNPYSQYDAQKAWQATVSGDTVLIMVDVESDNDTIRYKWDNQSYNAYNKKNGITYTGTGEILRIKAERNNGGSVSEKEYVVVFAEDEPPAEEPITEEEPAAEPPA